nr:phasin family protein [uncultured Novosphingobium sp.]
MAGQEETKDEALAEKAYEAAAAKTPVAPLKAADAKADDAAEKASDSKPAVAAAKPLPGLPQPVKASAPAAPAPVSKPAPISTPTAKPAAGKSIKPKVAQSAIKPAIKSAPAAKAPEVKAPVVKTAAPKAAAPKASVAKAPVPAAKPPVMAKPAPAAKAAKPVPAKKVVPASSVSAKAATAKPVIDVATPAAAAMKAAEKIADPKTNTFAGLFNPFILEEKTMDISANFAGFQGAVTEAQAKAKAAFEKSSVAFGEAGDFAKGNVEAVLESGKILAEGLQGFGSEMVTEGRTAFETFTGDIKELAAAKSPTDFFKLQGDIMRKNFDSAVAYGSKNSEAALKLFSDTMAPISGRVSVAVEKARHVAA